MQGDLDTSVNIFFFFCERREKKRELALVHVHVYSGKKKGGER